MTYTQTLQAHCLHSASIFLACIFYRTIWTRVNIVRAILRYIS